MSALEHEIKDAGYILTLNRPAEGVLLTIPTIMGQTSDPSRIGGGPNELEAYTLLAGRDNGFHYIHNPGAYFLLSASPAQALQDHHILTDKNCGRTVHFRDSVEKNLNIAETQFHKLSVVMTMRPVSLQAACDALTLTRFDRDMHNSDRIGYNDRAKLKAAFAAVQDSLAEIRDFKVDSAAVSASPDRLLQGYIALRRDKSGHDSYIQSAEQDKYYVEQRKNYAEQQEARNQAKTQLSHFEVTNLGRACHYRQASDALIAIAHFNKAAPGDRFYAVHAQYFLSKEAVSLPEMKEKAFSDSAALLEPVTQETVRRLRENKLTF